MKKISFQFNKQQIFVLYCLFRQYFTEEIEIKIECDVNDRITPMIYLSVLHSVYSKLAKRFIDKKEKTTFSLDMDEALIFYNYFSQQELPSDSLALVTIREMRDKIHRTYLV